MEAKVGATINFQVKPERTNGFYHFIQKEQLFFIIFEGFSLLVQ